MTKIQHTLRRIARAWVRLPLPFKVLVTFAVIAVDVWGYTR